MNLFKTLTAIGLSVPTFVCAQINANNQSTVISGNQGTITIYQQTGITLQEHQKAIELEKKSAEDRLRILSKKQESNRAEIEQLKNKIQLLNNRLKSIEQDKAILVASITEYQKRFGSLLSVKDRDERLKKYPASDRDIVAIEMSQESKNAVLAEVLTNRDNERLMRIVDVLMRETESMDDAERVYWKKILPTATFEQRFRFLDILATERIKLADLERNYQVEIKQLNEKHIKEWEEYLAKEKVKKAQGK